MDKRAAGQETVTTALEDNLRAIDIPPRPLIIDRIRDEMMQGDPCLRRVGQLISADVGLAAGLIKTAGSPSFGLRTRVRSVADALMLLGLDVTSRAVAAISLRRAFPNSGHYVRFWDASARIAALSGWLAQEVSLPGLPAADAYTFGLFRDCGIVILLRRLPTYMQTLARANGDTGRSFTAVERAEHPTDHAVVGGLMAVDWWLPEEICQAIRHHHDRAALASFPPDLPTLSRRLIAVSQTAEHLLQQLSGASRTQEWAKLGEVCLPLLGIDEEDLRQMHPGATAIIQTAD
ncbi:HDOD domain-containing protein [Accumulibacter sp.]|uniref:HDOD domain-containing protein n=1 Tax=Accumulibacter sp. TaxID=2053492 RepID=UPI0025F26DD0|nr:HDOD domain-containing protein [Accumulibacter sp.]MCM8613665.1 HDOD domain-containing protein [Accumulibacter sp.]MCM8637307.1 HDOD domain-containing protein [Accumulibacter sp.]MCM8638209.1 HDOD domain-containing protein [Accumulibacter sp.]